MHKRNGAPDVTEINARYSYRAFNTDRARHVLLSKSSLGLAQPLGCAVIASGSWWRQKQTSTETRHGLEMRTLPNSERKISVRAYRLLGVMDEALVRRNPVRCNRTLGLGKRNASATHQSVQSVFEFILSIGIPAVG